MLELVNTSVERVLLLFSNTEKYRLSLKLFEIKNVSETMPLRINSHCNKTEYCLNYNVSFVLGCGSLLLLV